MNQLGDLLDIIKNGQRIAVIGHRDGDGDSFGSMFSLKFGLEQLGKEIRILSNEPLPPNLAFFNKFEKYGFDEKYLEKIDLLIIIDTPDLARTSMPEVVRRYKEEGVEIILIDHHQKGDLIDFANCSYIEQNSCSTSEMIYGLLKELNIKINKTIATFLLTGIETDTTSFQNQNTTSKSLEIASELISLGARLGMVTKNSFSNQSIENYKIYGTVLSRLKIISKSRIAISYLTFDDIDQSLIDNNSMTGISNTLNVLNNVNMLMILTEENKGLIKVSLRTRKSQIDVGKIAKRFGGGGHAKAAGFLVKGHLIQNDSTLKIV